MSDAAVNPARLPVLALAGAARGLGFQWQWILVIVALSFLAAAFEGIGVGLFLPVLEFINAGGDLGALTGGSEVWRRAVAAMGAIGLPVNLPVLLAAVFVMVLCRQFAQYTNTLTRNRFGQLFVRTARQRIFAGFLRARLDCHDRLSGGEVVNEMLTELNRALSLFMAVVEIFTAALLGCAYLAILVFISPTMCLVSIGTLSVAALLLVRPMRRIRPTGEAFTRTNQLFTEFLFERVKSIRLIRLSGMEAHEAAELHRITDRQFSNYMALIRLLTLGSIAVEPIVLALAMVLLYVSVAVLSLPIESVLVFFLGLLRLLPILRQILSSLQTASSCRASLEVVSKRLRELEDMVEPEAGREPCSAGFAQIEFRNVHYRYHGAARDALRGVSFSAKPGQVTAIVGPSGAGKSTLIDLIPRLRVPDSGQVLLNGRDLSDYDLSSLRGLIAYVPQSPVLFSGTPAEHIAYGAGRQDRAALEQAAKLANADGFIRAMPGGYDAHLGEAGAALSGGQRQRLELARALARDAHILILDEPTSQLDAQAEADFHEALRNIRARGDITIIIIAHRLASITYADIILVVEDGQIVEAGSHAAIMARQGWYSRAFHLQQAPVAV